MADTLPPAATPGGALKEPPGAAFKCCCPVCAVVSHEGCGGPALAACVLECWFTMFCWTPKDVPIAGAPMAPDMAIMDRA